MSKDLIDRVEFDTIYHEHLYYYSLTALNHLLLRHSLVIADVEHIPAQGGTLRVFAGKLGFASPSQAVEDLLADETAWGVDRLEFYKGFGQKVEGLKQQLVTMLKA